MGSSKCLGRLGTQRHTPDSHFGEKIKSSHTAAGIDNVVIIFCVSAKLIACPDYDDDDDYNDDDDDDANWG